MKRFGFLFILMLLVTACSTATPAPTPDIAATAQAVANTMVAGTLTAQPTNTLAPTDTPIPTVAPSATITLVPTDNPAAGSPTAPATMTLLPGASPTVFIGTFSPGDISGLPTAMLEIDNLSGQPFVLVSLTGKTATREQVVYYNQQVSKTMVFPIVIGSYSVLVQIPNKRYISMSFSQTNKDKTVMSVYLTKVVVHGP